MVIINCTVVCFVHIMFFRHGKLQLKLCQENKFLAVGIHCTCCTAPLYFVYYLKRSNFYTTTCTFQELFEEASKHPLHWALQDRSTYIFRCITDVSKQEHCSDESRRLLDINPFSCILRLQERKSEKPDEKLENRIRKLIGRGKFFFKVFFIKVSMYKFGVNLRF